jgi:hypothetical protein
LSGTKRPRSTCSNGSAGEVSPCTRWLNVVTGCRPHHDQPGRELRRDLVPIRVGRVVDRGPHPLPHRGAVLGGRYSSPPEGGGESRARPRGVSPRNHPDGAMRRPIRAPCWAPWLRDRGSGCGRCRAHRSHMTGEERCGG